jgi:hypothetical protein
MGRGAWVVVVLSVVQWLVIGTACSTQPAESGEGDPALGGAGSGAAAGVGGTPPAVPGVRGSVAPPAAGSGVIADPSGSAGSLAATGGSGGAEAPTPIDPASLPDATSEPIPESCQAFPLLGMHYSPGGDIPPNKCAKFHPTFNNPYAVRCIDAIPGYDTGFAGDEYCILPPPPDKGLQVGFYPHGDVETYWAKMWAGDFSAYQNPPPDFVLEAGGEITENYRGHSSNPEAHNYYRTYFRMRSGSHHNIITMHESDQADGWLPGAELPGLLDPGAGTLIGILGGQQRPDDSTPITFEKPIEDAGLYLEWPAKPSLIFNLHHFNPTDKAVLREGWSNIWWEDDAQVKVSWYMGLDAGQVLLLNVAPEETQDLHYYWPISAPHRLLRVFGHRHAWTSNFSSWIKRANGDEQLIYQSYDWFDMPTYRYDSAVQNPPLSPEMRADGAISGVLDLAAGDELHFNCHVEYTAERAQGIDAPITPTQQGTLRFANEAYRGEMCIQFGNVTGGSLGLPGAGATSPPDFATR